MSFLSKPRPRGCIPATNDQKEEETDPKKIILKKQAAVRQSMMAIQTGLDEMATANKASIAMIQAEFECLQQKFELRRDSLIKQLEEIAADKKEILTKQCAKLEEYSKVLEAESIKEAEEIDVTVADRNVALKTLPKIIMDIDNDKLSAQIDRMGDVNNTFPPNPPVVTLDEVKAHTCKVLLAPGSGKYDGFQKATTFAVEIAFGPKNQSDDDEKVDFDALKWVEIARRDSSKFVRVKKLKPSTVYYVKARCKNQYGWSDFCDPVKLETYVLKINTKIMTSDEIQILIDLIKEKRKKKSVAWKLLFRGSDDGFLASTFHLKCDDVPNTICVIESNHGNVFGGFTTLPWKSDVGRYHVDEEAFVYIVRKKKKALKKAIMYLQYTSSQHSVVHNKYMGPVFGYGHDIYIRNKADQVADNSCRNHTYQCSYAGELAGEEKFKVINYEVFQISHPQDDEPQDDE